MNLLLTGGTGYLGSSIAIAFAEAGHSVAILKRRASPLHRLERHLSRIRLIDICEAGSEWLCSELQDVDTIVHAATCYGRRGEAATTLIDSNVLFPLRLLEVGARQGVRRFVNVDTLVPAEVNSYARSKFQFLEWGRSVALSLGIGFVNVKIEHIYGPGDNLNSFPTWLARECLANIPKILLTYGEQQRDFVFIDDVVEAFETVVAWSHESSLAYSEFQVGGGRAFNIRDFAEMIHRVARSRSELVFGGVPYRAGEPMITKPDTAALNSLGWRARVDLASGVERLVKSEMDRLGCS